MGEGPNVDALFSRLSQADIQGAAGDVDIDTEIRRILATRPMTSGSLNGSARASWARRRGKKDPRLQDVEPIQATFIRGTTSERALVIAGVHGTEEQGIEVAEMLRADLLASAPVFTVIVVPRLFPHADAARVRDAEDKGGTPSNRNFPPPDQDLATARAAGGGSAIDAEKRPILEENVMLLELIERFQPSRIISIHGTRHSGAAGVSFDPRGLRGAEVAEAGATSALGAFLPELLGGKREPGEDFAAAQRRLFGADIAARQTAAVAEDTRLSSSAAVAIDTATSGIPGGKKRGLDRESDPKSPPSATEKAGRKAHPSVAGNVGPTGALDNFTWSGGKPGGVSLGDYASKRGISIFTVEPPVNLKSTRYPAEPGRISQANRRMELKAYADAVRTVLLGT